MVASVPGSPRQTGQVCVLGAASGCGTAQAQNILLAVRTWQWTSIPMTASQRSRAPAPTEPCRSHAALPGGGATAVPTGLAGSGLAEVEDGHFVGCVQPNDDGTCGGRPASSS